MTQYYDPSSSITIETLVRVVSIGKNDQIEY